MKKAYIHLFGLLPLLGSAQTVNQGLLIVDPGTEVSTYFDFKNESTGDVLNDGSMHFYGHYNNEGLFSYTTNSRTGYVVFEGLMPGMQKIEGTSPSSFYDVLFNKSGAEHSFHLTTTQQKGIYLLVQTKLMICSMSSQKAINRTKNWT